jgi:hypothetical protein
MRLSNAWMNRLIAEASQPSGELFPPVTSVNPPTAPVPTAGLSGPVELAVNRGPTRTQPATGIVR